MNRNINKIAVENLNLLNPLYGIKNNPDNPRRLGSSRLPKKILKNINGESLLEIHLKRLKNVIKYLKY